MNEVLRRDFPLSRPEVGMLIANGSVGAMIWGQDNILRITINRSDFWLHKPGVVLGETLTYKNIRDASMKSGPAGVEALTAEMGGRPRKISTQLPLGRIDLTFPKDTVFKTGYLHLKNGKVVIDVSDGHGNYQVSCYIAMDKPILNVHFPPNRDCAKMGCVTAWEYAAEALEALGLERPAMIDEPGMRGWVQKRPGDPPLCVGACSEKGDIYIVVRYGDSPEAAKERVRKMAEKAKKSGSDAIRTATATFWANHWRWVPHIDIPNETLSFLYYYGTYLFASLTMPGGVMPTIYGPWVEESSKPPFDGGYTGMINLRMCYWPAFRANLTHHCKSLFVMIDSWKERLEEHARTVCGIDGGVLLPAVVDDRCARMAATAADACDPGGACLVAQLMYDYFLYTQDSEFLRTTAYPFMVSVMRTYTTMLEKDKNTYSLPFSVSPAFRGARGSLTGKNASFQLACVSFLAESLIAAAQAIGEEPDASWEEIRAGLPKTAAYFSPDEAGVSQKEIGLFDGFALDDSDAVHSHLAAISPFGTLDLDDKDTLAMMTRTMETWVFQGMGAWNAVSLPWASMIHTRLKNADMAELLIEIWERVFTNEGHAPVLDPLFMGFSLRGTPDSAVAGTKEVLHMDGLFGATAAIMEMLLTTRRGVNYLFSGTPQRWKNVSFDNIRTEGAFEVGATRRAGRVIRVSVKANAPGVFRLANPWSGKVTVQRAKTTTTVQGPVLEISLAADERAELTKEG